MLIFNQLSESFKFALHALQGNRLRTFLSLLGITIGIFAIILVYSVVDSLEKNIRSSVEELGDNILYVQKWPFGGGGDFPWWKYLNRPEPTPKDAEAISKLNAKGSEVVFVFGTSSNADYRSNTVENVEVIGGTYDFASLWSFELSQGRYFTEAESNSGKPFCIIGADVAEGLFALVADWGLRDGSIRCLWNLMDESGNQTVG